MVPAKTPAEALALAEMDQDGAAQVHRLGERHEVAQRDAVAVTEMRLGGGRRFLRPDDEIEQAVALLDEPPGRAEAQLRAVLAGADQELGARRRLEELAVILRQRRPELALDLAQRRLARRLVAAAPAPAGLGPRLALAPLDEGRIRRQRGDRLVAAVRGVAEGLLEGFLLARREMVADQPGDPDGAIGAAGDVVGVLGGVERRLRVAGGEMDFAQEVVDRGLHLERPQ